MLREVFPYLFLVAINKDEWVKRLGGGQRVG